MIPGEYHGSLLPFDSKSKTRNRVKGVLEIKEGTLKAQKFSMIAGLKLCVCLRSAGLREDKAEYFRMKLLYMVGVVITTTWDPVSTF